MAKRFPVEECVVRSASDSAGRYILPYEKAAVEAKMSSIGLLFVGPIFNRSVSNSF
jgi:hypothetical protein